jgi:hypothetical protein
MKRTRKEAIASGETQYFTGKPCKHGHISARQTVNSACLACMKEYLNRDNAIYKEARSKNKE